jgi:hypothetical protein
MALNKLSTGTHFTFREFGTERFDVSFISGHMSMIVASASHVSSLSQSQQYIPVSILYWIRTGSSYQ